MKHVARWFSKVRQLSAPALLAIGAVAVQNARELVFAFGMALLAYGLSQWSIAVACIVPGGILVWLAIPPTVKRSK